MAANIAGAPERELLTRFEVQKFLGKGSYGSVYRVRRLSDNQVYALKETNVRNLSQQERQEAVNEIRLLASVQQNTAISGFHEAFIDGNRLCIVMEYAPFGDLSRALRKRQAQRKLLPEDLIWSYFIQIARGLQALHAQKILHRDVKTANVLRMSGEVVKLGDLGVAKLMKGAMTNTQIGTPHYMPPEVWRNRPYTYNSDVWALGCVLFEMCTFTVPFEARSMEELRNKVMKGKFPALPAVYSADMQKMVKWLLIAEPTQRPDVNAVLSHPSTECRAHLAPEPEAACPQNPNTDAGTRPSTLETIKVPKNLRMLKKRLPAPNYPDMARHSEPAASWPRKAGAELPPITALSSVSSPGPALRRAVSHACGSPLSVGDGSPGANSVISAPAGDHNNIREALNSSINSAPAAVARARAPVSLSADSGVSGYSNIENVAPVPLHEQHGQHGQYGHGNGNGQGQGQYAQRGPGGLRPSDVQRAANGIPAPVKLPVINSATPGARPGLMAHHQGLHHQGQQQQIHFQQQQQGGGYVATPHGANYGGYGGYSGGGGNGNGNGGGGGGGGLTPSPNPYVGAYMQKGMPAPLQSVSEEPAAVLARAGLTPAGAGGIIHGHGQGGRNMGGPTGGSGSSASSGGGGYGGQGQGQGGNKRVGQPPSMVGHPGFGHLGGGNRRPSPMARNHYW